MKEVKLTSLLENIPLQDHPRWLKEWEDEDIDYLVRFCQAGHPPRMIAIGPSQQFKTLARALQEKKFGIPVSYTPSMHFSLRTLEYKKDELEGRILLLKSQEREITEILASTRERTGTGERSHHPLSSGEMSEREKALRLKEEQFRQISRQLERERILLDEQAQFVESTEASLNQHFDQIAQREAEVEQREEELRRKAFRLGVAL